jgi:hypothetical protein
MLKINILYILEIPAYYLLKRYYILLELIN